MILDSIKFKITNFNYNLILYRDNQEILYLLFFLISLFFIFYNFTILQIFAKYQFYKKLQLPQQKKSFKVLIARMNKCL